MAKNQRNEERITPQQAAKIHQLYRKYNVDKALIAERFGVDENAIKDVLSRAPVAPSGHRWRVKWDDADGSRHEETWETFRAAKLFHASLGNVEWSKVEPI